MNEEKYYTKLITTKLKRYGFVWWSFTVLGMPLFIPLSILNGIGHGAKITIDTLIDMRTSLCRFMARKYNWNAVAKEQYNKNKDKFKL